jgi:hypothetical protein
MIDWKSQKYSWNAINDNNLDYKFKAMHKGTRKGLTPLAPSSQLGVQKRKMEPATPAGVELRDP